MEDKKYIEKIKINGEERIVRDAEAKAYTDAKIVEIMAVINELHPPKALLTVTIYGGGAGSTFADHEITFEQGMTWDEWANSEYNTLGFDGSYCNDYMAASINKDYYGMVNPSDVIEPNEYYYFGT